MLDPVQSDPDAPVYIMGMSRTILCSTAIQRTKPPMSWELPPPVMKFWLISFIAGSPVNRSPEAGSKASIKYAAKRKEVPDEDAIYKGFLKIYSVETPCAWVQVA